VAIELNVVIELIGEKGDAPARLTMDPEATRVVSAK
jgi:hypothetical protein